jgi:hypothetical protein
MINAKKENIAHDDLYILFIQVLVVRQTVYRRIPCGAQILIIAAVNVEQAHGEI